MRFIADFHIHSHFSIATSRDLVPEKLAFWARRKGISVVGTGDFTHPGWLAELREKLTPAENGLYALKDGLAMHPDFLLSPSGTEVRFLLTAEISTIYKKHGKVRKVHHLIFAPDFQTVEKIQRELSERGNIQSDGRPILGIDSHDLLNLVLECSERCFFVPAHIWTPWFSALGAKSGFDTIDACYGDLSHYISAVETGLSSDPPMNWICSFLDRFTIISNSDAHSPEKLGREANLFETELDYDSIVSALKPNGEGFRGTVEFFPQEGKYHYDGHRKCGVRLNPLESLKKQGLCPVCGKKLTIGVLSRVAQLADREDVVRRKNRHAFHSLIPLKELLSEINGTGVQSKKVKKSYDEIMEKCESELGLLIDYPLEEIRPIGGELLVEGIARMRSGTVHIQEGYDGEYGRIHVFKEGEIELLSRESFLFDIEQDSPDKEDAVPSRGFLNFDIGAYRRLRGLSMEEKASIFAQKTKPSDKSSGKSSDKLANKLANKLENVLMEFNEEQRNAVMHAQGPALVLAGPGTGKTRVLAGRIANLLRSGVDAGSILAVTFSNRAAEEMRRRVSVMLEDEMLIQNLHISTFHAFGLSILKGNEASFKRTEEFVILDDRDRSYILATLSDGEYDDKKIRSMISKEKRGGGGRQGDLLNRDLLNRYEESLILHNAFDYDDLIYKPLMLLKNSPELLQEYRRRYTHILIDEYQDINSSQYQLIRLLKPGPDTDVFAIGDPDQAIYGFRGADAGFINSFYTDYPGAATYSLSRSYRCSSYILKASQGVIGRSEHKPGFLKGLLGGVKVRITELSSDRSEAEFVARSIERMMGGLRFFSMDSDISEGSGEMDIESLSDFVILCRLKEQMGTIVEALVNHSIPHQLVGTTPFYRDEPFSSVIDLLRLSIMPGRSLLRNRMAKKGILHEDEDLKHRWKGQSVLEAAMSCLTQVLSIEKPENNAHFNHFVELCRKYGKDMQAFLHSVDLGSGTDTYREELEQVTVMTIHAAKGLEFPCVFVIGCEDGLLPFTLLPHLRSDMDEERRLLYVAMTRAQKLLILSHSRRRYMFGKPFTLGRSRFLDTVEEELLDVSQAGFRAKHDASHDQLELF